MSGVLKELDFRIRAPADEVLENSRVNTKITAGTATNSPTLNNIVRLQIAGNGWLDLSSVNVYATVTETAGGTANLTPDPLSSSTCIRKPSTGGYCSQFRIISGGGQVIEDMRVADLYYELMNRISSDCEYQNNTLDITTNGHSNPANRRDLSAGVSLRVAVTDISGFLNSTGKYIYLPSFGGSITLEFTLRTNEAAYTVRAGGDSVTYAWTNTECRYDTVMVSEAYQRVYNEVFREGFALTFPTYSVNTNNVSSLSNAVLQLNKKADRIRDIITVVRDQAQLNDKQVDSHHFLGGTAPSVSYMVAGRRFPPAPLTSHAHIYQELLKCTFNQKNVKHAPCINSNNFLEATDASADIAATEGTVGQGCFCMPVELEQVPGNFYSGTSTSGVGDMAEISLTPHASATGPYRCDTFINHIRVLSVSPDGILVSD